MRNFHLSVFHGCRYVNKVFSQIIILMPFIDITCAEKLIFGQEKNIQDVMKRVLERLSSIPDYCGHTYQKEPMKLRNICRLAIRKCVFDANRRDSNVEELNKLKSLPAPKELIRLSFKYNNYVEIKEILMM